jgi:hypothetical protein
MQDDWASPGIKPGFRLVCSGLDHRSGIEGAFWQCFRLYFCIPVAYAACIMLIKALT